MKKVSILLCASLLALSCATVKNQSKSKSDAQNTASAPKPKKKPGKIKDYDKVITKDAITDDGLFKVHLVDEKYYFEIHLKIHNIDWLIFYYSSYTLNILM